MIEIKRVEQEKSGGREREGGRGRESYDDNNIIQVSRSIMITLSI